jgi:hypothetical protein
MQLKELEKKQVRSEEEDQLQKGSNYVNAVFRP